MKCKSHYPVQEPKWKKVEESRYFTQWKCNDCGEEFGVKQAYGDGNNIIGASYQMQLEAARPLVQPFRDGVPSAEYVKLTGGKNMSKEDIKRAKPVWSEIPGLRGVCNRDDSSVSRISKKK